VWIFSPEQQDRGGHLIITEVVRIPPESLDPRVKNFHWGDMTRALFEAYDRGGETAVLVDMEGYISEGPGFNVFCVETGKVISPGATVLEGITKQTVRELCAELDVPFEIGHVTPPQLRGADEVFVSSTAGGIMPITRIDNRTLGSGRPGALSTKLRDLYWKKHEQGWHATPVRFDP
jgi:branched-chain amino acid aminotransferase